MDHEIDLAIYGEVVGMFIESRRGLGMPILYSDSGFPVAVSSITRSPMKRKPATLQGRLPTAVWRSSVMFSSRSHTVGTRAGYPTPESMVADNDLAVGILVDAVANSPFWSKTAIFIVQDDPQGVLITSTHTEVSSW